MFVFIDESGIHKQDGQSTTALVYVQVEHLETLDGAILKAEKDLRIKPFHWREESWKIRQAFLELLIKQEFTVKIFVSQNPFTEEKFENGVAYLLSDGYLKNIIIDGKKPRGYILRLKKVLRDSGVSVAKIRMGNDKSFPCLRLADLFAGIIRAYFDNAQNKEAKKLYKMAKIKITTLTGGQTFQISRP